MAEGVFNEASLRADIVKVWGEFGAHVEVYDFLVGLASMTAAQVEALRRIIEGNDREIDAHGGVPFDQSDVDLLRPLVTESLDDT